MEPILLAANAVNETELMWTVTASGILVVFGVLILLVAIFYLFGAVMNKGKKKDKKSAAVKTEKVIKNAPAPVASKPAPVVEQGISPEIVAAISAAIAYSEGGAQYTIRSIKRQQRTSGRPAWAMAGIADNTRPF